VLALGVAIFKEPLSVGEVVGILLICGGLIVGSRWP
jgi:multidrug transporter EmrE-like cation transporter